MSLDSIRDDTGRRLVENLESVGWNGVEAAFKEMGRVHPNFSHPSRRPVRVTCLGAGAVGGHAVQAAHAYGDPALREAMVAANVPGVEVTVVDFDLTRHETYMLERLERTDLLVDATSRRDPSVPVIPNPWLAALPPDAILLDLSSDPYLPEADPPIVKGIEGVPQGDLDRFLFRADDPAWDDAAVVGRHHQPPNRALLLRLAGDTPGGVHAGVRGADRAVHDPDPPDPTRGLGRTGRHPRRASGRPRGALTMAPHDRALTFGFPRMHKEPGERRDVLPPLVQRLSGCGAAVAVESGIGSAMGFTDDDYRRVDPTLRVVGHEEAYARTSSSYCAAPPTESSLCCILARSLVSMLHFPTRPERVADCYATAWTAIAIDCILDDDGGRLVEDSRAVAWNALEAAFDALETTYARPSRSAPSPDPRDGHGCRGDRTARGGGGDEVRPSGSRGPLADRGHPRGGGGGGRPQPHAGRPLHAQTACG